MFSWFTKFNKWLFNGAIEETEEVSDTEELDEALQSRYFQAFVDPKTEKLIISDRHYTNLLCVKYSDILAVTWDPNKIYPTLTMRDLSTVSSNFIVAIVENLVSQYTLDELVERGKMSGVVKFMSLPNKDFEFTILYDTEEAKNETAETQTIVE